MEKVLRVALCPALLCQAPRLIKKPAETGWAYTVILQEVQQHMWTAFTQRPSSWLSYGWNDKNVTDLAQSVFLPWLQGINFEDKCLGEREATCIFYLQLYPNTRASLRPQALPQGPQISNA